MEQHEILAKGQKVIDAETKAQERRDAAKVAVTEYIKGKSLVDLLKNPVVTFECNGESCRTIVDPSSLLDNSKVEPGHKNTKQQYTYLLGKLADAVAADAARTLGKNAPRIDRNKGVEILKNLATMLGYTDYTTDKRDFDYIGFGMKNLDADADVRIRATRKTVNKLFRARLNGWNVRILMQGGVEYSADYLQAKNNAEKEAAKKAEEIAKAKAEREAKKAAKEKAVAEKKAAKAKDAEAKAA